MGRRPIALCLPNTLPDFSYFHPGSYPTRYFLQILLIPNRMLPIPPLPDRRFAILKARGFPGLSGAYLRELVPDKQAFDFLPVHRITPDAVQFVGWVGDPSLFVLPNTL
jgi:hypothetical protein